VKQRAAFVRRQPRTCALTMHKALPFGLALLITASSQAQPVLNGGFENWTNTGNYSDPTEWLTSNMVTWYLDSVLNCEQGTPAPVGDYFVKVSDRMLNGTSPQSGSITIGVMGSSLGYPFTQRPDALNGLWQYHPQNGGNDGVVNAALTRWNPVTQQREVIANAPIHVTAPITSWQPFSSPFLYYSPLDPDSVIVSVQATNGIFGDGTSIWVDDLSFGAYVNVQEAQDPLQVQLWPSPAHDQLAISAPSPLRELIVQDMSGRVIARHAADGLTATVPVDALPPGLYLADLRLADGRRAVRSFAKE
jgi:hypothetical protein